MMPVKCYQLSKVLELASYCQLLGMGM